MVDSSHVIGSSRERGGYCTPTMDDDDERHAHFVRHHLHHNTPFPQIPTQRYPPSHEIDGATRDRHTDVVWKERIRHFTWTFFTMTMATGGVANVLRTGSDSCFSESYDRTYRADYL